MRVRLLNGRFDSTFRRKKIGNLKPFLRRETSTDDGIVADSTWREGRRVVELGLLADRLNECSQCGQPLQLSDINSESHFGLASVLHITCRNCQTDNLVSTGSRHSIAATGPERCFDVNTKLAAAIIDAGVGETQMNNILAALNIPCPHHKSLKEREREIGKTIELVAETSCEKAICEEINATNEMNANSAEQIDPEVSSDGAWQRRGTGQNNNSLSGHVTVVGKQTKKCLDFNVAKKTCRTCSSSEKKKKTPPKHNCRKNWSGSSKGMEPFLTINSILKLKNKGLAVKKITMDDDCTTFIRAKRSISDELTKSSDKNHVTKNFTNELYKLREKNKSLTVKTVKYFTKCFSYALSQNKGNPVGLKANIEAIVPHAFGSHEKCNQNWCKFLDDPANYHHKSLPYGKDLTDASLRTDLDALLEKYTSDSMSQKLTDLQSSNSNENLNQMVARKAPKAMHYSGSESLDYRVSAAVSQKNEGRAYLLQVNESHKLSPGKFTQKRIQYQDKKRQYRASVQNSIAKKKRRLQLKEERSRKDLQQEALEGTSYKTSVSSYTEPEVEAIDHIPEPLSSTLCDDVQVQQTDKFVVFDLETTGFGIDSSIIQIAAAELDTKTPFDTYVQPSNSYIPKHIAHLTQIEMHGTSMYHKMVPVKSVDTKQALGLFRDWLAQYNRTILVAHNVQFDSKILVQSCQRHEIQLANVIGFGDTLAVFRREYPGRAGGYSQTALVRDILGSVYDEHNAVADVRSLLGLVEQIPDFKEKISVTSVHCIKHRITRLQNEKQYIGSYSKLVNDKYLTKTNAKALAASGLGKSHIELVSRRSGAEGLALLLCNIVRNPEKVANELHQIFNTN